MEILKGEVFVPNGKFDEQLEKTLREKLVQDGHIRRNGFAVRMNYLEQYDYFINPLAGIIKDKFINLLKPKLLINVSDNELVSGVAGKKLNPVFKRWDGQCYWIVEKFLRIEWDLFGYRIYKHEMSRDDEIGHFNFKLKTKQLFERNFGSYPSNPVLRQLVKEAEREVANKKKWVQE